MAKETIHRGKKKFVADVLWTIQLKNRTLAVTQTPLLTPFDSQMYRSGLCALLERRWYDAHEDLEHVWRQCTGDDRLFLQALIQGAVCLEHRHRDNQRESWGQLRKAREKANRIPSFFMGIHLDEWLAALHELDPQSPKEKWPTPQLEPALERWIFEKTAD